MEHGFATTRRFCQGTDADLRKDPDMVWSPDSRCDLYRNIANTWYWRWGSRIMRILVVEVHLLLRAVFESSRLHAYLRSYREKHETSCHR